MADLRGGDTRDPPSRGPNSFNSMQFLRKFAKIVCWHPPPPPRGVLAPSPRGNPRSSTGTHSQNITNGLLSPKRHRIKHNTFVNELKTRYPLGPICFIFMQFSARNLPNNNLLYCPGSTFSTAWLYPVFWRIKISSFERFTRRRDVICWWRCTWSRRYITIVTTIYSVVTRTTRWRMRRTIRSH